MANPLERIFSFLFLFFQLFYQGLVDFLKKIIFWFGEEENIFLLKVFFFFLDFFLFLFVLILIKKISLMYKKEAGFREEKKVSKKKKQWREVEKLIESNKEEDLKKAIIRAEEILESVLEEKKIEGKTWEEKIRNFEKETEKNLEDLRKAHSFKEKLISEKDFKPPLLEMKVILSIYEHILKEIGAL